LITLLAYLTSYKDLGLNEITKKGRHRNIKAEVSLLEITTQVPKTPIIPARSSFCRAFLYAGFDRIWSQYDKYEAKADVDLGAGSCL